MSEASSYERYHRQIILKDFGDTAQDKLRAASILVVGAGGLGCPLLQYLAAAGAGCIGIADDDVVALSNLHRQPLYSMADIGKAKVQVAAEKLQALNPDVEIHQHTKRVTSKNALEIIKNYDIVADASDNFATRYLVNDACVLLGKPLVFGAVSQWEGQLAIFNAGTDAVNYRDLFPQPPSAGTVLNCAEAGVPGPLPGIIGTMMANELIKLITGTGKPMLNKMFLYNAWNNQQYELALSAQKEAKQLLPANAAAFMETDYDVLCNKTDLLPGIDEAQFFSMIQNKHVLVLDVREPGEMPPCDFPNSKQLSLSQLPKFFDELKSYKTIITICQTGVRSRQAAALLVAHFSSTIQILNLQHGIINLKKITSV